MYLRDNPVLQRELLVNLRTPRAFVLLFLYQALLALLVVFAWPQETRLDLSETPDSARRLVNLFFLGQYILASLMAPSFAAGTITGEKERKTYEMLLASPLRPTAIVLGKLLASLAHLLVLIFASLPIVMLCLPLGGVSFYEVLAAYLGLIASVTTFGMISVACSSYFSRTAASLVVSYLLILPLALAAVLAWYALADYGQLRFLSTIVVAPVTTIIICWSLLLMTRGRLLHPPDVGSEGKDVIDLEAEASQAVGLVIRRDQFPDKLFAPPKRNEMLPDGINPILEKEIRSEIFSQGTLMLRLVIQISMLLCVPLMAVCLYIYPALAPWYICYVLVFNVLVGPVFSAGSVTSERERQTLDLLLTTTITPWTILWGKYLAGLRVSSILTAFLMFPLVLACIMVTIYWANWATALFYVPLVLSTCILTSMLAMFCSTVFRRTSVSLMTSYLSLLLLFVLPLAVNFFAATFYPDAPVGQQLQKIQIASPFAAAFAAPLEVGDAAIRRSGNSEQSDGEKSAGGATWGHAWGHVAVSLMTSGVLLALMVGVFSNRRRLTT